MTLGQRVAVMRDGVMQQCDTPQNLFHPRANLFVAAFMGSRSMNLIDAAVSGDRVTFAGFSLPLRPDSPLAGEQRRLILGIRPTDFKHGADASAALPRITVRTDVIEELGGVSNLLFLLDAPRVVTDATRAAAEAGSDDEGTLRSEEHTSELQSQSNLVCRL